MYTILEVDLASRRPLRRIPILITSERDANHYADVLNRRTEVAKLRIYVVQKLFVTVEASHASGQEAACQPPAATPEGPGLTEHRTTEV